MANNTVSGQPQLKAESADRLEGLAPSEVHYFNRYACIMLSVSQSTERTYTDIVTTATTTMVGESRQIAENDLLTLPQKAFTRRCLYVICSIARSWNVRLMEKIYRRMKCARDLTATPSTRTGTSSKTRSCSTSVAVQPSSACSEPLPIPLLCDRGSVDVCAWTDSDCTGLR